MQLVSYSPGKGGGGLGTIKNGIAKGKRSAEYALSVIAAANDAVTAENKTNGTNAATGFKAGASYAGNIAATADSVKTAANDAAKPAPLPVAQQQSRPIKMRKSFTDIIQEQEDTQRAATTALNNAEGKGAGYGA